MRDLMWQVTALLSFITFSVIGIVLRSYVARMDYRRDQRRNHR